MVKKIVSTPVFQILLVLIIGFIGYSNTLNAPFVFDDVPNIVDNPIIKNLNFYLHPSESKVFDQYTMLMYRYIGSITFAINYKIHGLNVTGYHVFNILIHLINSVLVYWLVFIIFKNIPYASCVSNQLLTKHASFTAFFSALLFVAHPIQIQAVTYIVQRFASLATMFYVFSLIMYLKARLAIDDVNIKHDQKKLPIETMVYCLVSLLSAVLAMKTKEIAFTLPVMITMCEFLLFRANFKKRILYLFPFVLTMLIIPLTLHYVLVFSGGIGSPTRLATDMTRLDYLFTEFRVIITYLRIIFLPVGLNVDYDYKIYHSFFDIEVFLSFAFILILSAVVVKCYYKFTKSIPYIIFVFLGTVWFFITLSVESSFIPIADVIFEHRMYLPSIGIFMMISVLLVIVIDRYNQEWVESAVVMSVVLIAVVLAVTTYSRNILWNDGITLWQDVVNKSPEKARGYVSLGQAYSDKGSHDKAITYFKRAISLDPSDFTPHLNLGVALGKLGHTNEAIIEFKEALRINPHDALSRNSLGTALGRLGLINEAISEFKEVLRKNPENALAHSNLGIALGKLGKTNEAIKEFEAALRINPDQDEARNYIEILKRRTSVPARAAAAIPGSV